VPQTYKIDQAATFAGMVLLSVEPKLAFGTTEQERTGDGVPKWEAQLAAGFRHFGKISNEILKVGVASHTNPGDGLPPYTPVELVGFEVGVMPKTKRNPDGSERILGVQVWYRAEQLRSISSAAPRKHLLEGS
jgi:hypothetical protein